MFVCIIGCLFEWTCELGAREMIMKIYHSGHTSVPVCVFCSPLQNTQLFRKQNRFSHTKNTNERLCVLEPAAFLLSKRTLSPRH